MRFYSKRDLWIGILLLVLPMILWVTVIVVSSGPFFNLFYGIMMAFLAWIYFFTRYELEGEVLKIYCGPWRSKIKIMDIGSIKSSRNPLSAPACSLDRLEVKGHHIYTLISPKEKDDLIQALLRINPDITIK